MRHGGTSDGKILLIRDTSRLIFINENLIFSSVRAIDKISSRNNHTNAGAYMKYLKQVLSKRLENNILFFFLENDRKNKIEKSQGDVFFFYSKLYRKQNSLN